MKYHIVKDGKEIASFRSRLYRDVCLASLQEMMPGIVLKTSEEESPAVDGALEKLTVNPKDVVVFRPGTELDKDELGGLTEELKRLFPDNQLVLVAGEGLFEILTPECEGKLPEDLRKLVAVRNLEISKLQEKLLQQTKEN